MTESKWRSRKLAGFLLCLVALIVLAQLGAPGEAYTALGLLGVAYLGGQATVDAVGKAKGY